MNWEALITYLVMSFLWSIFSVRIHLRLGYPRDSGTIVFVWGLNFVFAPIGMLMAIVRCPVEYMNKDMLRREVKKAIDDEIADALRGDNLKHMHGSKDDEYECESEYPRYGLPALSPDKLMAKWGKRLG